MGHANNWILQTAISFRFWSSNGFLWGYLSVIQSDDEFYYVGGQYIDDYVISNFIM